MPLTFDIPREELENYTGRNPKPEDFDLYWERALDEMHQTNPEPELTKADFQLPFADCYHLFFTGVGGSQIHAKLVIPRERVGPVPAVFQFHGYSMSAGDWTGLATLAAGGIAVAAMDCRGQGGMSEDMGQVPGWTLRGHIVKGLDSHPDKMYFRQVYLDTAMLVRVVAELEAIDETRLGAQGGSQGGGLTLACAALDPRIKKLMPVYPFLCDYQRVWEMDQAKDAYDELREWFRRFDPRHEREQEVFQRLGYIDIQHLAPRIQGEVLMLTGLMDTICPPSTQFAAFNKIKSEKRYIAYPDYGHEWLPDWGDIAFEYFMGL